MIETIAIDNIHPDPSQPRKTFDQNHIDGLALSLQQEGMINAIEVRWDDQIITGECRWRAAKQLGWELVPINRNNTDYTEYEKLRHQLAENLHQSGANGNSMTPIDTAEAYAKLLTLKTGKKYEPGMVDWEKISPTVFEVAKELGVKTTHMREHLALLEQPSYVIDALRSGVPRTYFREADHAPKHIQESIKQKIAAGNYTSREQVMQDVTVAKNLPDLMRLELAREKDKEDAATSKIFNSVINLALALEKRPFHQITNPSEVHVVEQQLRWISKKIITYLREEHPTFIDAQT